MLYPCFLQRWNSSIQTGHKEAAPARDASQCQDQWPDNAPPLSRKPYFLKLYFLSLCFLFCNLLNSNFYTLTDNWVLIPSRSCLYFISFFFHRAHVVSEYWIPFPLSFSYKSQGKWKAGFAYNFTSSTTASSTPSSVFPHPSSFCRAVNIILCCHLHISSHDIHIRWICDIHLC